MRPGGLTYQLVKPSHLGWQVGDYPVERKTVLDHGPHLTGLQIPVVVDKKKNTAKHKKNAIEIL